MKSLLSARAVCVRTPEHIRGHFLICVPALTPERLLHLKLDGQGLSCSPEFLRDVLTAPKLSPIIGNTGKEPMYLKTGFSIDDTPQMSRPTQRDSAAEADTVMRALGMQPLSVLESRMSIRRRPGALLFVTGAFKRSHGAARCIGVEHLQDGSLALLLYFIE